MDPKLIGKLVADRRESLGMRQADLAKTLDVGRSTMSQYESGKIKISTPDLFRIAKLLKVPMTYFSGETPLSSILEAEFRGEQFVADIDKPVHSIDDAILQAEEFQRNHPEVDLRGLIRAIAFEVVNQLKAQEDEKKKGNA